jgi:hypothetical protein
MLVHIFVLRHTQNKGGGNMATIKTIKVQPQRAATFFCRTAHFLCGSLLPDVVTQESPSFLHAALCRQVSISYLFHHIGGIRQLMP